MCVCVVDTFFSYTNETHNTPSDQMRTTQNPRRTSAPPPPPILQFWPLPPELLSTPAGSAGKHSPLLPTCASTSKKHTVRAGLFLPAVSAPSHSPPRPCWRTTANCIRSQEAGVCQSAARRCTAYIFGLKINKSDLDLDYTYTHACTYSHKHTHACTRACTPTLTHTHTTHSPTNSHTHTQTHTHSLTHPLTHTRTHTHTHMHTWSGDLIMFQDQLQVHTMFTKLLLCSTSQQSCSYLSHQVLISQVEVCLYTVCVHTFVYMYVCVCVCAYVCPCVCVCVAVHMHMCTYIVYLSLYGCA